jgi:hypothetical protein
LGIIDFVISGIRLEELVVELQKIHKNSNITHTLVLNSTVLHNVDKLDIFDQNSNITYAEIAQNTNN